ncbi:MAG: SET domain-containing protein-lysine N-methyltransferase [Cyclobacteriaceae bacterium]|nr:SET domain-containing protein-lysine N-methyltransferase [Cyclobacteriaceae bacterium]
MIFNESNSMVVDSQSEVAEKRTDATHGHRSLFSKENFSKEDVIADFYWDNIYPTPTYLTVQISEHEHILLRPEYLECINHSCDPNAFFDTTRKQLIAVKSIEKGEQFTFFYPSAEWDMDQPFQCQCGSKNCIGMIKGAKYLPENVLSFYRFTDFIKGKLASKAK